MKTPTEILSQLERVEYRYKRYNTLYAYQIGEILDTFKNYDYDEMLEQQHKIGDDKWNINKEKIQKISQNKLPAISTRSRSLMKKTAPSGEL